MLTFCACNTGQRRSESLAPELFNIERQKFVTVSLDGDVKSHGKRQIRRGLSRANILEAAEGFAGLSAAKPQSVTIRRGAESYKVEFKEMGKGKWKHFLINEGDKIIVNTLFF